MLTNFLLLYCETSQSVKVKRKSHECLKLECLQVCLFSPRIIGERVSLLKAFSPHICRERKFKGHCHVVRSFSQKVGGAVLARAQDVNENYSGRNFKRSYANI